MRPLCGDRRALSPQHDGAGFLLRYAGAIDDKPSSRVKDIAGATNHVRAALDAGLAGNAIAVTQTQPYGCDVKY